MGLRKWFIKHADGISMNIQCRRLTLAASSHNIIQYHYHHHAAWSIKHHHSPFFKHYIVINYHISSCCLFTIIYHGPSPFIGAHWVWEKGHLVPKTRKPSPQPAAAHAAAAPSRWATAPGVLWRSGSASKWGFPKSLGVSQCWMVYFRENPTKMDDFLKWGVALNHLFLDGIFPEINHPAFRGTTILENPQIVVDDLTVAW